MKIGIVLTLLALAVLFTPGELWDPELAPGIEERRDHADAVDHAGVSDDFNAKDIREMQRLMRKFLKHYK
jgi:hypothetical protein